MKQKRDDLFTIKRHTQDKKSFFRQIFMTGDHKCVNLETGNPETDLNRFKPVLSRTRLTRDGSLERKGFLKVPFPVSLVSKIASK